MSGGLCVWAQDEAMWLTECGEAFVFEVDGPMENNFVHCPYCGRELSTEEIL